MILVGAGFHYVFASPNVINAGNVASYSMTLVFLTANKSNSIVSFLFGISFERLIGFHRLAALTTLFLAFMHAWSAWDDDVLNGTIPTLSTFFVGDSTNLSGSAIVLAMLGLILSSAFPVFRRHLFDVWLFTHFTLIITLTVACALHSVAIVLFAFGWWLIDLAVRYLVMARCRYPTNATIRKLKTDVIEISFPKPRGFHYNPGQFVMIAIPQISIFQYHPFSLSSAPHDELVTLHIRPLGDWTKRLVRLAETQNKSEVMIWIEGPYGALSVDLDSNRYGMVLCVCGGIGVTHCRSVARSLLYDHCEHGRRLEQLRFVWAVRDYDLVNDVPPFGEEADRLLAATADDSDVPLVLLKGEVYMTNSKHSDLESVGTKFGDQHLSVQSGRPDLDLIFTEMREEALKKGITHVAVIGCGPQNQIDSLKEACRKHSNTLLGFQGVAFDLHYEVFEF
jgi:NADPH oxidase